MKFRWNGFYIDGQSPVRTPAFIHLYKTRLEIEIAGGERFSWPYEEIRQTQGFYEGEEVRFERGEPIPQALIVRDITFLFDLHQIQPDLRGRFHHPRFRNKRKQLTFLAALSTIAISLSLYIWGIPFFASQIVPYVPVKWEVKLGEGVLQMFAPIEARCTDENLQAAIETIRDVLIAPLLEQPYSFRLLVVDSPMVNALAAPGGGIVIFRGLLEQTDSPEELAGVISHEMQHVLRRHSTLAVLQDASTGILLAALAGDTRGAMKFGIESAQTLGMLRYSRLNEEEADREGIRMLMEAKVDPDGMIRFFGKLEKGKTELPDLFIYLSTHPTPDKRQHLLEEMARLSRTAPVKLLPEQNWDTLKKACRET